MKAILVLLTLLSLASCCAEKPNTCDCDRTELSTNDSILNAKDVVEALPKLVAEFKQKGLKGQTVETYRLMTSHSFNVYDQVFTLKKTLEGGEFIVQEYHHPELSNKCKLMYEQHSKLTASEWKAFKKVIDDNCFWTLPVVDKIQKGGMLDGGYWYIEGYQPFKRNCSNSNYLFVSRRSPEGSSERFHNVYKAMMKFVDRNKIHETKL